MHDCASQLVATSWGHPTCRSCGSILCLCAHGGVCSSNHRRGHSSRAQCTTRLFRGYREHVWCGRVALGLPSIGALLPLGHAAHNSFGVELLRAQLWHLAHRIDRAPIQVSAFGARCLVGQVRPAEFARRFVCARLGCQLLPAAALDTLVDGFALGAASCARIGRALLASLAAPSGEGAGAFASVIWLWLAYLAMFSWQRHMLQ